VVATWHGRLLKAEDRVLSQSSPFGIYNRRSGTTTGLSPSNSVCLCCHSISALYSHSFVYLWRHVVYITNVAK